MDVLYNYYIPDGKNSRLLDRIDRIEFNRETIGGNMGFKLEIPYLEYTFGTKYFIMDRITGGMMGIYDDKVKQIDLKGQLKPFNIISLIELHTSQVKEDWGWTHLQSQWMKFLRIHMRDSH